MLSLLKCSFMVLESFLVDALLKLARKGRTSVPILVEKVGRLWAEDLCGIIDDEIMKHSFDDLKDTLLSTGNE